MSTVDVFNNLTACTLKNGWLVELRLSKSRFKLFNRPEKFVEFREVRGLRIEEIQEEVTRGGELVDLE